MTSTFAEPVRPHAATTHSPVLRRCGGRPCPPGTCDHDDTLRRHASGHASRTAPAVVHRVLTAPGEALEPAVRSDLEPRFGHDFSAVRIHTDAHAAGSADAVAARAYTVGNHIAFAAGAYRPGTDEGRRLLAHELTHSLQQAGPAGGRPAPQLDIGDVHDPAEGEAESVAASVSSGGSASWRPPGASPAHGDGGSRRTLLPRAHSSPRVARQDAGSATPDAGPVVTPDAGTVPTPDVGAAATPDSGTPAGPDAGTGGPGVPGPGIPAPPPPPRVVGVEVEDERASVTHPVPSNLGGAGRRHRVTLAGSRPPVSFRAVLDRPVAPGDPAISGLSWSGDPPAALAAGTDALHATVPVPTARKVVVRAALGASQAETTLWAIFVAMGRGGATVVPTRAAARLDVAGAAGFTGTIHPPSLITDADRPALDGPNTVPPPGGANICGTPLAGGADHRWDVSRQRRLRNLDPAGLLPAIGVAAPPACLDAAGGFPAAPEIGNDDTGTTDESNDPYAGGGVITSTDTPARPYPDAVGTDGDTLEQRLQFREFARLEFNRTWWKVSAAVPWRVHYRVVKVAGRWQDNGSDAADDNAGF